MSLVAFVSTMVGSAMDLKGASRLAFYDRILHQSVVSKIVPETVNGLRDVNANGSTILPTESFVVCDQFFVLQDNAMQFKSRWRNRMSRLAGCDGFVSFDLLRRDVKAKGHSITPVGDDEPSYMTCTIWRDRAAFEGWRMGSAFGEAHGSGSSNEEKGGEQLQKRC